MGHQLNTLIPTQLNFPEKILKITCSQFSGALSKSGKIYFWGNGPFNLINQPTEYFTNKANNKIVDLVISSNSAYLLDCSNNLFCWGINDKGQLGVGDRLNRREFVLVQELKGKNINRFCESSWNKFTIFLGNSKNVNEEILCSSFSFLSIKIRFFIVEILERIERPKEKKESKEINELRKKIEDKKENLSERLKIQIDKNKNITESNGKLKNEVQKQRENIISLQNKLAEYENKLNE